MIKYSSDSRWDEVWSNHELCFACGYDPHSGMNTMRTELSPGRWKWVCMDCNLTLELDEGK